MKNIISIAALLLLVLSINAQSTNQSIIEELDQMSDKYGEIAFQIWDYAELGYQEEKSAALLIKTLEEEGFSIHAGIADIPTAFYAEYGSGYPVIAILGEMDALPGMSQKPLPTRESAGQEAGHACGHHLFGTGSAAAAIAVKNWMIANSISGTVRFYGCPAEEGGSGKVHMARAGVFDDVDAVLHWHPDEYNDASAGAALAIKSVKFKFYGKPSHAAWSPHRGRSALDGVEAMNHMVNLMREHIPDAARIHYAITHGGDAPNVVPGYAEVLYYIRHNDSKEVENLYNRVLKAAKGAAIGTETRVREEVTGGTYEIIPNLVIQEKMYNHLKDIGGFTYTDEEKQFARELVQTLDIDEPALHEALEVRPYRSEVQGYGSTDVGDVSFMAPTAGVYTATWVPGTPAHSWQATACGRTSIAQKGMILASKVMALTAADLLSDHDLVKKAYQEHIDRIGADFEYVPLMGDKGPDLDYMKKE